MPLLEQIDVDELLQGSDCLVHVLSSEQVKALIALISQCFPVNLAGQQHFLSQQLPPFRQGTVAFD